MQKVNGKGYLLQQQQQATRTSNAHFQAIGIQDHFAGGLRYS
jgi:hypothetical protein